MKNQNPAIPVEDINRGILTALDNDQTTKVAQAATDFTRTQLREDSFMNQILPFEKCTNEMLDRDMTENLQRIEELEPGTGIAKWAPLQTLPESDYMRGARYKIPFARLMTRRYQKDIDQLRTWRMDLRKVIVDNALKDAEAMLDSKFLELCLSIVQDTSDGNPGAQVETGKVQWLGLTGGLDKDNWIEASKMLPKGNASDEYVLRNYIALMNDVTAQDWLKLGVEDIGDENVSKNYREGLTQAAPYGVRTIFTTKRSLVPDNRVWFFPKPEFLGKAYYLQDWTMFVKKEAYFIEQFAYWLGGFGIGNVAGVCMADFDYS